jgi:hypothetical protein
MKRKTLRQVMPFEQGALDTLCGIYSLVNADKIINERPNDEYRELFSEIIEHLHRNRLLTHALESGLLFKHMRGIVNDVINDRIPHKETRYVGLSTPSLGTFWNDMYTFLNEADAPPSAIIVGLSGKHDHWTVVSEITKKNITLYDSDGLKRINRNNCTTASESGSRKHVLHPAQTYFMRGENRHTSR